MKSFYIVAYIGRDQLTWSSYKYQSFDTFQPNKTLLWLTWRNFRIAPSKENIISDSTRSCEIWKVPNCLHAEKHEWVMSWSCSVSRSMRTLSRTPEKDVHFSLQAAPISSVFLSLFFPILCELWRKKCPNFWRLFFIASFCLMWVLLFGVCVVNVVSFV